MTTYTLYRAVGSKELEAISRRDWRAFSPPPLGISQFRAYTQPVDELAEVWTEWDPRDPEAEPEDLRDFRQEWQAWGNANDCGYVVAFELPSDLAELIVSHSRLSVPVCRLPEINASLVGVISLASTHQAP